MKKAEKLPRTGGLRNSKSGIRIVNSRKKDVRFQVTRRQILMIISMVFLLMGSGIGYVWSNYERTQIGYDLSELKKEEMKLLEMNRKLRLELAMRKSTQNLEELAIKKLGLRQPSSDQVIVLP